MTRAPLYFNITRHAYKGCTGLQQHWSSADQVKWYNVQLLSFNQPNSGMYRFITFFFSLILLNLLFQHKR